MVPPSFDSAGAIAVGTSSRPILHADESRILPCHNGMPGEPILEARGFVPGRYSKGVERYASAAGFQPAARLSGATWISSMSFSSYFNTSVVVVCHYSGVGLCPSSARLPARQSEQEWHVITLPSKMLWIVWIKAGLSCTRCSTTRSGASVTSALTR